MSTQTLRPTRNIPLPTWARPECQWTLGVDLQSGDTIYFNSFSHPRHLDEQLQTDLWRATINGGPHGYGKIIPNTLAEVDPDHWYVVKRAVQL